MVSEHVSIEHTVYELAFLMVLLSSIALRAAPSHAIAVTTQALVSVRSNTLQIKLRASTEGFTEKYSEIFNEVTYLTIYVS